MLFYVLIDKNGAIRFSPVPDMDKLLKKVLRPGLPLSYLQYYLKDLLTSDSRSFNKADENIEKSIINLVVKGLKKDGTILKTQFEWYEEEFNSNRQHLEKHFSRILKAVQGRKITEGELLGLARLMCISNNDLVAILNEVVSKGLGEWQPALSRDQSGWTCERCNGRQIQEWPSLYGKAATCQECEILGSQTSLQTIFRFDSTKIYPEKTLYNNGQVKGQENVEKKWSIEFTNAQAKAAKKLLEFSDELKAKEVLLWAACGAGKTEVSFPLIARFLAQDKKVLFTAPRQDVVHDVHPRLQKNFPNFSIKLMSGAVTQDFKDTNLTVATTHQVLKFYRFFDLIIFDEVDAYPYSESIALKHGLKTALRETGQIVYLTATPSDELLTKVAAGKCPIIRLPIRYHGQPLPLPLWIKIPLKVDYPINPETIPGSFLKKLEEVIRESMDKGPLLVFLPLVALVPQWVTVFKKLFPLKTVAGSWSSDPNRREKVALLQDQKYDIFLTTSILERGITISRVQVIVLYADHEIYDIRSLVQMAGRAGRTKESPTGAVIFLSARETEDMKSATAWIQEQNFYANQEEC